MQYIYRAIYIWRESYIYIYIYTHTDGDRHTHMPWVVYCVSCYHSGSFFFLHFFHVVSTLHKPSASSTTQSHNQPFVLLIFGLDRKGNSRSPRCSHYSNRTHTRHIVRLLRWVVLCLLSRVVEDEGAAARVRNYTALSVSVSHLLYRDGNAGAASLAGAPRALFFLTADGALWTLNTGTVYSDYIY